eukprot:COSAG01_NODE_9061_length_2566_cov_2.841103_2_plen_106_part_00
MCEPVCFDIMEMIGTEYQKVKETQKNKKMYGEIVSHLKEYFNLFLEDNRYLTGDPYGEPSSWKYGARVHTAFSHWRYLTVRGAPTLRARIELATRSSRLSCPLYS